MHNFQVAGYDQVLSFVSNQGQGPTRNQKQAFVSTQVWFISSCYESTELNFLLARDKARYDQITLFDLYLGKLSFHIARLYHFVCTFSLDALYRAMSVLHALEQRAERSDRVYNSSSGTIRFICYTHTACYQLPACCRQMGSVRSQHDV